MISIRLWIEICFFSRLCSIVSRVFGVILLGIMVLKKCWFSLVWWVFEMLYNLWIMCCISDMVSSFERLDLMIFIRWVDKIFMGMMMVVLVMVVFF